MLGTRWNFKQHHCLIGECVNKIDCSCADTCQHEMLFWLGARYCCGAHQFVSLQWRNNGPDGVSNHQPHQCVLKRIFECRSKKISKLCVTGLCAPHKWPVKRKMFPFDDVIMYWLCVHKTLQCDIFRLRNALTTRLVPGTTAAARNRNPIPDTGTRVTPATQSMIYFPTTAVEGTDVY